MRQKSWAGAFRHAADGIVHSFKSQRNLKFHVAAAAAAVVLAAYFRLSAAEWGLLALTIAGVIAAELFNTAVEAMVDLVSPQVHHLAKTAKDAAAGAVLVMALASLAVGYVLFFHRLFG
ncbi:MAG: diacylglycerol kinase family protein [Negativicutes bacterium]|nr:diacylglycerol kinase family protein [Negativicutes bacterium]